MAQRALNPLAVSDGRWEVYLKQNERFKPPTELAPEQLVTLSTDLPVEAVLAQLAAQLETPP